MSNMDNRCLVCREILLVNFCCPKCDKGMLAKSYPRLPREPGEVRPRRPQLPPLYDPDLAMPSPNTSGLRNSTMGNPDQSGDESSDKRTIST